MKKTYSKPTVTVVQMNYNTSLLAGSEQSMGVGSGTKSAGDALSPGYDFDSEYEQFSKLYTLSRPATDMVCWARFCYS